MIIATYIALLSLAIFVILMIRKYTSVEFVSHARLLFKTWSVRLSALGVTMQLFTVQFSDSIMHAWLMLPPDIKGYIPADILKYISIFLMCLAPVAQYIRQDKLVEQNQGIDNGNGNGPTGQ